MEDCASCGQKYEKDRSYIYPLCGICFRNKVTGISPKEINFVGFIGPKEPPNSNIKFYVEYDEENHKHLGENMEIEDALIRFISEYVRGEKVLFEGDAVENISITIKTRSSPFIKITTINDIGNIYNKDVGVEPE